MSAEIITLSDRRSIDGGNAGNGALELMRDYLGRIHPARMAARSLVDKAESDAAVPDADYFLAWLWDQGFKIEPIE
jgi:hypothetical protein